jgi:hypothetical protein
MTFRLSLLIIAALVPLTAYTATSVETYNFSEFRGRRVAEILALGCSDKTWPAFSQWARRTHFTDIDKATNFNVVIDWNRRSAQIENQKTDVIVLGEGMLRAHIGNKTINAADSCELIVKAMKEQNVAAATWSFFPQAQAADVVKEDMNDTAIAKTSILTSIAVMLAGHYYKAPVAGLAGGATLGYIGGRAIGVAEAKQQMMNILNNPSTYHCDDTQLTVTTGKSTIVVNKKSQEITVEENGKTTLNNNATGAAKNSRDYLLKTAAECHTQADADGLTQKSGKEIAEAKQRMGPFQLITPEEAALPPPGADTGTKK